MSQNSKDLLTSFDFIGLGGESLKVHITTRALIDLHKEHKAAQELLTAAKEGIKTMSYEDRKSFCETVRKYLKSFWEKISVTERKDIENCIESGNIDGAKNHLANIYIGQRENFLSLERTTAKVDAASAFGVICYRMHFIFSGYRKLKLNDEEQMVKYRKRLASLKALFKLVEQSNDPEQLENFLIQVTEFTSNVFTRTEQRYEDRNSALVQGLLYGFKALLNLGRWFYLRDPSSIIYVTTGGLCAVASGTSFYVASEYHELATNLEKELKEVIEFKNEIWHEEMNQNG